jgi:hypothetical protein
VSVTDRDNTPLRGRRDTHEQIHRLEAGLAEQTARIIGVDGSDGLVGKLTERVTTIEAKGVATGLLGRKLVAAALSLGLASVATLGGALSLLQRSIASGAVRDEKIHQLEQQLLRLDDRIQNRIQKGPP